MLSSNILATIETIATGTPDNVILQSDAAKTVANLPHLQENASRIEKIYYNTRIYTRHLALNLLSDEVLAWCQNAPIQERMRLFHSYGVPLALKVAKKALANMTSAHNNLETVKDSIRQIVLVSSTGFVAPGIDTALINNLGLRRDISRVTVNFMGCAAAMNGIRVASDHVLANPTHKSLVVCLELSSINAVFNDNINDVIIHSIFGDGCAAVIVGASEAKQARKQNKVVIRDYLSYLIENSEDGINLGVEDTGITCKLSRYLPDYIEAGVGSIIKDFLATNHLTKENIDLWAVHPGGTRILEKVQISLSLEDSQLDNSWKILWEYGNMLSASVLFVLEKMLFNSVGYQSNDASTGLAFSFSPGVGLEGILFEKGYVNI